ncbi:axonemal dynein light intermediate polypeptide 1-like [Neoarius graeffei]|uniref:axonemal dynein light intermediate polypeptide 1-like n=1 Tax=Neoarius graeffei TaxID=443677 RepID=UPI00298BF97A|nr:axonemal dynein light intermediate polypeptide 1-like [Neoarius graeffei]
MISSTDSLLKYDCPELVSKKNETKSSKDQALKATPTQPASVPVPPSTKHRSSSSDAINQQTEDVLHVILPPRKWMENDELWVQQVSSRPCTRTDVIQLQEELDLKLYQRQARDMGICPVRRELYTQCFDELLRQVTISCAERGLLLSRVRDELRRTISAYQTLFETSVAFGMRKALQADQGKMDTEKKIADLENEKSELERQLNEQKAIFEAIERQENERRQIEEKKHAEETEFLKRTNLQLKNQLDALITPMERAQLDR